MLTSSKRTFLGFYLNGRFDDYESTYDNMLRGIRHDEPDT